MNACGTLSVRMCVSMSSTVVHTCKYEHCKRQRVWVLRSLTPNNIHHSIKWVGLEDLVHCLLSVVNHLISPHFLEYMVDAHDNDQHDSICAFLLPKQQCECVLLINGQRKCIRSLGN